MSSIQLLSRQSLCFGQLLGKRHDLSLWAEFCVLRSFELEEVEEESGADEKRLLRRTDSRRKTNGASLRVADFAKISQSADKSDPASNRLVVDGAEFVLDQSGIFVFHEIGSLGSLLNLADLLLMLVAEEESGFFNADLQHIAQNTTILEAGHFTFQTLFADSFNLQNFLIVIVVERDNLPKRLSLVTQTFFRLEDDVATRIQKEIAETILGDEDSMTVVENRQAGQTLVARNIQQFRSPIRNVWLYLRLGSRV